MLFKKMINYIKKVNFSWIMQVVLNHPHVVNNCVKRHVNIPTYSTSGENVFINEYVQGAPMYGGPYMYNQPMMFNQNPYMQQEPNMQNPTFDTNVTNSNYQGYQGNVNPGYYNPYRF